MIARTFRLVALAAGLGSIAICAPTSLAAQATPVAPRITSAGGINLVPTPVGLGLGGSQEQLLSSCDIGAGCAARTWQKLIGTDANNPDAVITMKSNVGVLPTLRLAQRDQLALAQQFNTYSANGGFAGDVWISQRKGLRMLAISGRFDQTLDDYVQLVQVRRGKRTVMISVNLDNRNIHTTLPSATSIRNLFAKARAALRQPWTTVPTTVLP